MNEVKLIAHGGYSAAYPENTLQSFVEAAKYQPYAIEMDVVQHPDTGELICFHPTGISSQSGTYSPETVREQLQQGATFAPLYEVVRNINGNIRFLIDLKQPSTSTFQALLNDKKLDLQRIIIGVRNMEDFRFIHAINPHVEMLALFANPDDYDSFRSEGGKYFRLWEKDATGDRINKAQQLGLEIWVTPGYKATAHEPRTAGDIDSPKLDRLVNQAANGILVNDIKLASQHLRERGE
jgi:glycerophosphoryl diester phosphodiesterase